MRDPQPFDHRPDPELGAALRAALDPTGGQSAFVARVMAQYDRTQHRTSIPMLEILASWFRPGLVAAAAAVVLGFLVGRTVLAPTTAPASIDAAMAPAEGPGLAALVTAQDPPDASVVFASLVEPQQ